MDRQRERVRLLDKVIDTEYKTAVIIIKVQAILKKS
jgi:hypothetical protein